MKKQPATSSERVIDTEAMEYQVLYFAWFHDNTTTAQEVDNTVCRGYGDVARITDLLNQMTNDGLLSHDGSGVYARTDAGKQFLAERFGK